MLPRNWLDDVFFLPLVFFIYFSGPCAADVLAADDDTAGSDIEQHKGDEEEGEGEEDDDREGLGDGEGHLDDDDDGAAAADDVKVQTRKAAAALNGDDEEPQYPDVCFPPTWYEKFPILAGKDDSPFWIGWANLRLKTFRLIENKYFETAVIIMILLSSLALVNVKQARSSQMQCNAMQCNRLDLTLIMGLTPTQCQALEDIYLLDRPVLQDLLYYMDRIFTVIFFLEMLIKWLALGFKNYFTNAWCWLDFIIVMVRHLSRATNAAGCHISLFLHHFPFPFLSRLPPPQLHRSFQY